MLRLRPCFICLRPSIGHEYCTRLHFELMNCCGCCLGVRVCHALEFVCVCCFFSNISRHFWSSLHVTVQWARRPSRTSLSCAPVIPVRDYRQNCEATEGRACMALLYRIVLLPIVIDTFIYSVEYLRNFGTGKVHGDSNASDRRGVVSGQLPPSSAS